MTGPDALKLLNRVSCNNVDVTPGTVVYTQWLNDRGGIEADLTIIRRAEDDFLVITSVASQLHDRRHLERHADPGERVAIADVSSDFAMLGLMGPRSRELLQALTSADFLAAGFPFAASRMIELTGVPVRATRITYVGELGYELLVPNRDVLRVYDALIAAGDLHGLRLAGYHAMKEPAD